MDMDQHWSTIREVVNQALKSTHFCAVATVNPAGSPRVSPIGSIILGEKGKAFYFEWQKRVRPFRRFKGYKLLWKDMRHVRDVTFDAFEPLHLGPMGRGLWEDGER